jgi:hypothetical protein
VSYSAEVSCAHDRAELGSRVAWEAKAMTMGQREKLALPDPQVIALPPRQI